MASRIKDLFKNADRFIANTGAREYISRSTQVLTGKMLSAAQPLTESVNVNVQSARSYLDMKVTEVRAAQSLGAIVDILVGILMTIVSIVMSFFTTMRTWSANKLVRRPSDILPRLEAYMTSISNSFVGLPNSPVVKKVEGVSKKVLGDSRHDQAVDFIRTNVIDKVYERLAPMAQKSPSGSSTADLTTEGGSVTGSSPRDSASRKTKSLSRQRK
jgi:hypothetical protein